MSSTRVLAWIAMIALCLNFMPQTGYGAQWNFSPYRAQVADGDQPSESETAVPADALQKKNIGKGVMFSLIIPGAGQLYAGSWLTAIPWVAIEIAGWAMFATYHAQGNDKTSEFEDYAGARDTPNNFDYRAYLFQEYSLAQDTLRNGGRPRYNGSFDEWMTMPWTGSSDSRDDRYTYLPAPFTHDVLTNDDQQFFEMIGKYFQQFGFGWRDTYNTGNGWPGNNQGSLTLWDSPVSGLRADNPNNREFDGESPMFFHYRDMRGEANDLLNKGNTAMEVVLANHVLSALHAAFIIRNYNKRVESSSMLGDLQLHYDVRTFEGSKTRFLTLTLPID